MGPNLNVGLHPCRTRSYLLNNGLEHALRQQPTMTLLVLILYLVPFAATIDLTRPTNDLYLQGVLLLHSAATGLHYLLESRQY
jgi:hypothetical protein